MHEKLPKDSMYYKHLVNKMFSNRVEEATAEQAEEDRKMMLSI